MRLSDLKDYKNWDIALKAAFWFIVASMLQKAFSFITVPIFTRIMETEQYGIYSAYLSWSSILAVFLTLDLDSGAYANVLGKEKTEQEKNDMTISYISLCFLLTTIAMAALIVFIEPITDFTGLPASMLLLMILGIYAMPTVNYWMFRQRFEHRYRDILSIVLIKSILNIILGLYLVSTAHSTEQAQGRVISTVLIEVVLAIVLYCGSAQSARKMFSTKRWRETLRFQLPLIPHFLSMNVLLSSDRIMIQKMVGGTEAGIYSVAYSAGQIMTILKACIVDAIRPWLYERLNKREYSCIAPVMDLVLVFVTVLSIIFATIAPELISIFAAPQYRDAVYVIPPVAISSLFTFIYQIFTVIETYYGKTEDIMRSSMSAAALNLFLNYLAIPIFGYLAAGYTTFFSYMLLSVFHYRSIKKIQREIVADSFFDILTMIVIALSGIAACVIISFLYQYLYVRYLIILAMVLAMVLSRKKLPDLFDRIKS